MSLRDKSIHELRAILQGYGEADLFAKDQLQLIQMIEALQVESIPALPVAIPLPEYDPKLMTAKPARMANQENVEQYLRPYVDRGLRLTFPEPERWHMSFGIKEDTGTLRMPLRTMMQCAEKVLQ